MRDDDLITEDEFEAKKKQLLGLASSFQIGRLVWTCFGAEEIFEVLE